MSASGHSVFVLAEAFVLYSARFTNRLPRPKRELRTSLVELEFRPLLLIVLLN